MQSVTPHPSSAPFFRALPQPRRPGARSRLSARAGDLNAEVYLAGAASVGPRRGTLGALLAVAHRLLNQALALLLLLLLAPLMMWLALMIWWHDGAPIFFGHYRVGHDGKLFRCLKFRSMRRDAEPALAALLARSPEARAEWQRDQKLRHDPRVTPIGRFLRHTSLDELPQLFNVLRGEMSLVGPRPITVGELTRYGRARWHYLSVRPGITGLWQVSGRNNTTYEERVALDKLYVERRTAWFDARILLKTVPVVLARHGAS
jgi:exopolysaccharide production protein ExoY